MLKVVQHKGNPKCVSSELKLNKAKYYYLFEHQGLFNCNLHKLLKMFELKNKQSGFLVVFKGK